MSNVDKKVAELEEMWKKVDALDKEDDLGFTVEDFAKRKNLTVDMARHQLDRKAQKGQLIKGTRRRKHDGRTLNVYRLP